MGFTRDARPAGMNAATRATTVIAAAAPTSGSQSALGRSSRSAIAIRWLQNASGAPTHDAGAHQGERARQHHAHHVPCVAPSAMRMPISPVRRATVYASSP